MTGGQSPQIALYVNPRRPPLGEGERSPAGDLVSSSQKSEAVLPHTQMLVLHSPVSPTGVDLLSAGLGIPSLHRPKGVWPPECIPRPHSASVLLLLLAARHVRRLARRMAFVIACTPTVAWPERRIGVGHWSCHPET
jgi:hypothetical protein